MAADMSACAATPGPAKACRLGPSLPIDIVTSAFGREKARCLAAFRPSTPSSVLLHRPDGHLMQRMRRLFLLTLVAFGGRLAGAQGFPGRASAADIEVT